MVEILFLFMPFVSPRIIGLGEYFQGIIPDKRTDIFYNPYYMKGENLIGIDYHQYFTYYFWEEERILLPSLYGVYIRDSWGVYGGCCGDLVYDSYGIERNESYLVTAWGGEIGFLKRVKLLGIITGVWSGNREDIISYPAYYLSGERFFIHPYFSFALHIRKVDLKVNGAFFMNEYTEDTGSHDTIINLKNEFFRSLCFSSSLLYRGSSLSWILKAGSPVFPKEIKYCGGLWRYHPVILPKEIFYISAGLAKAEKHKIGSFFYGLFLNTGKTYNTRFFKIAFPFAFEREFEKGFALRTGVSISILFMEFFYNEWKGRISMDVPRIGMYISVGGEDEEFIFDFIPWSVFSFYKKIKSPK